MSITLFEKLNNPKPDFIKHSKPEDLVESIQHNLMHLLNARQGALAHMPQYGLPDLGEIYRGMPHSITTFLNHITTVIKMYEPRLNNVHAIEKSFNDLDCVLSVDISANILTGDSLVFSTYFTGDGAAHLRSSHA